MKNSTNEIDLEVGFGVINSSFDIRDYKIKANDKFPEEYSIAKPSIKNQGHEGTCVAHALSSAIEYHYTKLTNIKKIFSTEFIYGYREKGYYIGDGMVIRDALKTIQKYGDPFRTDCKGNNNYKTAMENVSANVEALKELAYPHRISAYIRLNTNDEIKTALMENGPVIVSMKWYKNYHLSHNTYMYDPIDSYTKHCVLVYGWNKDGWLVQNSWGSWFGDHGRFIIPFSFKFNESWSIIDNIDDNNLEIITTDDKKHIQIFYKVINAIVNFFIRVEDNILTPAWKYTIMFIKKLFK